MKKTNKQIKSKSITKQWEELSKSEEQKYKRYIELTQISNLAELAQSLSKDFQRLRILTDY